MAFSVPTTEVIPIVLESDDGKPTDQQTVFHVRPRTMQTQNRIMAASQGAIEFRGGKTKTDPDKATQADVKAFLLTVEKVENFLLDASSDDTLKAVFSANGSTPTVSVDGRTYYSVNAETEAQRTAVARAMSPRDINDLGNCADDISRLREREKKS